MFSRRKALAVLLTPTARGAGMFSDAEAYERFMGRWSRLLAPSLVEFSRIPDAGRVLDVGSGTGALAFAVAKDRAHCRVLGIDPAKEYVGYAGSKNTFGKRVGFQTGDAQRLRFSDASFHASLSLLVFNFIPDPRKALREVIRVTRPGGCVCAAVWDYGAGMRMLRVFWDAAKAVDPPAEPLDEAHMPLCREGELDRLWREGGLNEVTGQPLDFAMPFASFSDYWDAFLLGQGPAGSYLLKKDAAQRSAIRAEVKRRLELTAEDVRFSLPARAWAVRGIR